MSYTEADVERWFFAVLDGTPIKTTMARDALASLNAAALEGAKVPGLQLRVMELDTKVRHAEPLADEVAVLVRRKVIDSRDPAADALLDFRDPPSTPRADRMAELEREVSALQARVADLERLLEKTMVDAGTFVSERDALRAQVERLTYERDTARLAVLEVVAPESKRPGSLSAPPAETKTMSDGTTVLYVLEVHAGGGEWEPAFLGTLASTVREKVDVKDRSMGPTRVAEYVRRPPAETTPVVNPMGCSVTGCTSRVVGVVGKTFRCAEHTPPAETTPAPEHVMRSCNLHADCDAADSRARADGRPKGVGHCNDADCPDHQ